MISEGVKWPVIYWATDRNKIKAGERSIREDTDNCGLGIWKDKQMRNAQNSLSYCRVIQTCPQFTSLGTRRGLTEKFQDNKRREHFTLKAKGKKCMNSFRPKVGKAEK